MNLEALIADWRLRAAIAHKAGSLAYAAGLHEAADDLRAMLDDVKPGAQVTGMFNRAFDQDGGES